MLTRKQFCLGLFFLIGCQQPLTSQKMSIILTGNLGRGILLAPNQNTANKSQILPFDVNLPSSADLVNVSVVDTDNPDQEVSAVISCTLNNPPLIVDGSAPFPFNNLVKFSPSGNPNGQRILARPSAIVQWGSGGATNQAVIDFADGFSFSVPASWLRVTAQNDQLGPTINGANTLFGRAVNVSAVCGIGSVGKSNVFNAKRTISEDNYNPVADVNFNNRNFYQIPQFGTNFLFYYFGAAAQTQNVNICDEGGQTLVVTQWSSFPNDNVAVELPSGAKYIQIQNGQQIIAGSTFSAIFGLSI